MSLTRFGRLLEAEPLDNVTLLDHFLGDTIDGKYQAQAGTDPQAVAPAIVAVTVNGVIALVAGDAGTGYAADGSQLTVGLNWSAAMGELTLRARIKSVTAVTNRLIIVGFTDTTAVEAPFTIGAADAVTSNASNAVCLVFDTAAATDQWFALGVKADVDAGGVTSATPVADTWHDVEITIDVDGNAQFKIDGALVASVANAVTAATALTPIIAVGSNTTAVQTLHADAIYVHGKML